MGGVGFGAKGFTMARLTEEGLSGFNGRGDKIDV